MATFIHFTSAKNLRAIRRGGLRAAETYAGLRAGVFALPTGPQFALSHQWLRELGRGRPRPLRAVYFRVADGEPVWIGRFGEPHRQVTAGAAAAEFFALRNDAASRASSRLGLEVIVPRAILPAEIHRVRIPPKALGWRMRPFRTRRRADEAPDQALARTIDLFPAVAPLARQTLEWVRTQLPGAVEIVSGRPDELKVEFAPVLRRYSVVLSMIGTADGVRLRFAHGAALRDPRRLLGGHDGAARELGVIDPARLADPALADLVAHAAAFAPHAFRPGRPRRVWIAASVG